MLAIDKASGDFLYRQVIDLIAENIAARAAASSCS
jgi:hypothetical protein